MNKNSKVKQIQDLLSALGMEHTKPNGFNEYDQFCTDLLQSNEFLSLLNHEALDYIKRQIVATSTLGLK